MVINISVAIMSNYLKELRKVLFNRHFIMNIEGKTLGRNLSNVLNCFRSFIQKIDFGKYI